MVRLMSCLRAPRSGGPGVCLLALPYHSGYPADHVIIRRSPRQVRERSSFRWGFRVSIDEQHVALPKLYGAPAYARPPATVEAVTPRPFDPDDLPIEAFQSEEDRAFAATLPVRAWSPGGMTAVDTHPEMTSGGRHRLVGRRLRLRSIAGRLIGD